MKKPQFHYGTSSWSEKGWVGPFYPPGTRPSDFLRVYAEQFGTVEADVTYYRIPDAKLVRGWADKTPANFRLSAKFPRSIVHAGEGRTPDGSRLLLHSYVGKDVDRFLIAMAHMGERCGPLVVQLPYLNKAAFAKAEDFLERLHGFLERLPADFRYAVEVRNKNWLTPALTDLLREQRAALVLSEHSFLPHPVDLAQHIDVMTTDFTYVRLIGDRKATEAKTKTFDSLVLDMSASLQKWAQFLRPAIARGTETFAYANNHYAGHGPATIRELAELVASDSTT
ncbi:MAG: hypothetical protein ACI841_005179 [Planctomycetota bacterium]|jgi:uncharacterized protein YecE (DUF72 family)